MPTYLIAGSTGISVKPFQNKVFPLSVTNFKPIASAQDTDSYKRISPSLYEYLLNLLYDLNGVMQSPKYHPEGCSLYHSLQVFQCALQESCDPELWAAALFHDIGKAIDCSNHADVGADVLSGIMSDRVCWMIRHHLDLLMFPKRCRKKYKGSTRLSDLEKLRRWDLAGRKTDVDVMSPEDALEYLLPHFIILSGA